MNVIDVLRQNHLGIAIVDSRAKIIDCTNAFAELLQIPPANVKEQAFVDYLPKTEIATFLAQMSDLVKADCDSFEMIWQSGNDTEWLRAQFASSPNDLPDQYSIVLQNISTLMDEHARLEREKTIAEQSTNSKSAFLATMSHEIRTPIHTMTGMTSLLLETRLDDEQKDYVDQIRFSADVLLGLINDILDFSKIEAGKLHFEMIDFDIYKTIESAVDMQALEAYRKGLEVILFIDPNLPQFCYGDSVRLRQILINLISNAVKFTSNGHVIIRVDVETKLENTNCLRFSVTDTGIGIAKEKQNALFQAFNQADNSMTRRFGGSGLGLSICKSLVQMMNGIINVESTEGQGSTFWFEVPLQLAAEQNTRKIISLQKYRILVIDDNAFVRQVIRQILEKSGAFVQDVADGYSGLELLRSAANQKQNFDAAIVDLEMSGMDGWRFASEVNGDRTINATRLIMASPPGKMAGEAKMKLLNWVDAYISKPIKPAELLQTIDKSLHSALDLLSSDEPMTFRGMPEKSVSGLLKRSLEISQVEKKPQIHVLVAEDHFVNQKLFKTILNRLEVSVDLANDGQEAVEKAKKIPYDLIFMDVQMPRLNGFEATIQLRKDSYLGPIIAVTANAIKGDMEKCLQAGMNGYLAKPFTKEDVQAVLDQWIGKEIITITPKMIASTSSVPEVYYDHQKALLVFMGDVDVVYLVVQEFIQKTPSSIEKLIIALDQNIKKDAEIIAHTLKGSSWNLTMIPFGNQAGEIEKAIREDHIELAKSLIPDLERLWECTSHDSSEQLNKNRQD